MPWKPSAPSQSSSSLEASARWAEWIEKRMDQPGTVFIAVGAGHLAGKDSVETMLEAKGLEVDRVQ